jgi:2-oxoglutarate ferredoxin oxidoreductase subunit alpha
MPQCFLEGNEAIAWGAFHAGCRFFAGYPITPATTIYNNMLKILPPNGGICIQGEDEIASIGYCLGASMAGMKVLTATSGPGISLYSENISFAIGSEIPIVIVDVQRLGPSTGSATRGADGDIQFLRWGNSGGLPVIVLVPADVRDCYLLTMHAFNLAEEFRCPVFIASNKDVGMTKEGIDLDAIPQPGIKDRRLYTGETTYLPFATPEDSRIPDFLPLGGERLVRQTSSTHGIDGYITVDPGAIAKNQERLNNKLLEKVEDFSFFETYGPEDADILVIAYGLTSRAAKSAVTDLAGSDTAVSLLALKTLWPTPEKIIQQQADRVKRVIVVEMNLGQYVNEIQRILPHKHVEFLGQMDGNLITPHQIKEVIAHG